MQVSERSSDPLNERIAYSRKHKFADLRISAIAHSPIHSIAEKPNGGLAHSPDRQIVRASISQDTLHAPPLGRNGYWYTNSLSCHP